MVDKLKKPLVLLMLAVVLLSCMPEQVQAVTVIQKDKHNIPEEHGDSIFKEESTLCNTCNSNRLEFKDNLIYSTYLEEPCDYCVFTSPDYQAFDSEAFSVMFISENPIVPYVVKDGEYGPTSLTYAGQPYEYDGKTYYICSHLYQPSNDKNFPEFVHQPPIIRLPDTPKGKTILELLFEILFTGDYSDCQVTAGDSDNPSINEPGGMPGSEDNPIYDEKIGTPILSGFRLDAPDVEGNLTGNNLEYYNVIKWKKKTSTGFNLNDSGYAVCRMQFKIEPKATFVELGKSTVLEPEVQTINGRISLGFCNASQLEKKFQYHDLISKFYGKFLAEHHPATNAQSYELQTEFNYFCRVAVSDSLSVIPNQSDGWKCGKWKRLVVSGGYQETDSTSDSGEIDEDGNWVSDEDYEDVDDSVTHTDDPANADDDDVKDMDYGTDDVKGLLKQVGQFPKLIKKIFSFLPSWCLTLFAFGFACMIVLLVIKTIRG